MRPFTWNGQDYVLKMATDTDFAAELLCHDAAGVLDHATIVVVWPCVCCCVLRARVALWAAS